MEVIGWLNVAINTDFLLAYFRKKTGAAGRERL